jgi:hypothetical protein
MEHEEVEVCIHGFLASLLDGSKCSVSSLTDLPPGARYKLPTEHMAGWAQE